jgi:predicted regulator of Ras-like GTPase activity (Roadblock/LC7/MglB family)
MTDDIRRLTELLAHDPQNAAFKQLAELLRRKGDLDAAHRVALRGLERHTLDAEAHALLARICVDRGELQRAFDEWDMALRLSPRNTGALKGLGFITYRWGRLEEAEHYLREAFALAVDDNSILSALESVRRARAALVGLNGAGAHVADAGASSTPQADSEAGKILASIARVEGAPLPAVSEPELRPQDVFRAVLGDSGAQAVLVDSDGLVVAGAFMAPDGGDRAQDVAAQLSGVGEEADRAMRHLPIGEWRSISFESGSATVALARAASNRDSLVVVAAPRDTPLGLVRRMLDKAQRHAAAWLDGAS